MPRSHLYKFSFWVTNFNNWGSRYDGHFYESLNELVRGKTHINLKCSKLV